MLILNQVMMSMGKIMTEDYLRTLPLEDLIKVTLSLSQQVENLTYQVNYISNDNMACMRQIHRQANVNLILCRRLRENGLSDSIGETDKPTLGGPSPAGTAVEVEGAGGQAGV